MRFHYVIALHKKGEDITRTNQLVQPKNEIM